MRIAIASAQLLFLFTIILSASLPSCSALPLPIEAPTEAIEDVASATRSDSRISRVFSPVRSALKAAPKTLNLGETNFLGTGVRRKSIAGAYASTAGVALGGAAITYQTMNMKSKNTDAWKKKASKYRPHLPLFTFLWY